MKVKTLASAIIAVGFAATSAVSFAADQGSGKISFKGSIIDAPCSIAQESQNQEVAMGQVANVALKDGKKSSPTAFKIELRGCELSDLKGVTATFNGIEASDTKLFALKGSAEGASLAIGDANGELIPRGTKSPVKQLTNGDDALQFTAYLQGNMGEAVGEEAAKGAKVTAGDFEVAATFALTYE